MKLSRRDVLRLGAVAGAGALLLPKKFAFAQSSPTLTPFVDPLPIPPVITPGSSQVNIHMTQFTQKLHRDLPATKLWGYNGIYPAPPSRCAPGCRPRCSG